jgi:L-lysine exporter family protein LysE/ArgO
LRTTNGNGETLRATLLTCLALTWLNPHVYLDTVGLIGAISTGFHAWPNKLAFGGGAILASFMFFFGLGYGARFLAPVFARPSAWAVLDVLIALVMWSIAASLILGQAGAA